jgi:transcriptional regulator with XRE-family HTH domain
VEKTTTRSKLGVGTLLRSRRQGQGRTQFDVALAAGISSRHLSFIETGRANPSAEMVLLLTEHLEVPLRERNQMLLAAGFAPAFPELPIDDPEMAPVREALDAILGLHDPNPAIVVDRNWTMVAANQAMAALTKWVDPELLQWPINVMRVGLHPRGLAGMTKNIGVARAYFIGRLRRQAATTGDPDLADLLQEVEGYPGDEARPDSASAAAAGNILSPMLELQVPEIGGLDFFFTVATFGTASEVTTSELSIEMSFPANAATAAALPKLLPK